MNPASPVSRAPTNEPRRSPAPVEHSQQPSSADETILASEGTRSGGDVVGVLVAIDSELKGQIFPIKPGENHLGRHKSSDVELKSEKISRSHAMLIHHDGIFVIKPLSDKNPTFLNDVRTDGDELGDGDTIRLGLTTLKFRSI